jgi:apolipoprotein D and lipocalin family protein
VESYHLDDDGTIATTFTFRKDGFGGKEKSYHPRGFVRDTSSNAEWGMQFVWLMARDPEMVDSEYEKAVRFITAAGYDTAQLQRVPQSW